MDVFILHFFSWFLSRFPRQFHIFIGNRIGDLALIFLPRKRKLVYKNLKTCFPQNKNIALLTKKSFHQMGNLIIEMIISPYWNCHLSKHIEIRGLETILEYQRKKEPVVLATAHFGSWETMSCLAAKGIDLYAFYRGQRNQRVDKLIRSLRSRHSMKLIEKKTAIRETLACLKRGSALGFAADHGQGVEGTFFSKKTQFPCGAAKMALKTGAHLHFLSCIRQGKKMIIEIENEISLDGKSSEEIIEKATKSYIASLETKVKKYPEQYFWVHDFGWESN